MLNLRPFSKHSILIDPVKENYQINSIKTDNQNIMDDIHIPNATLVAYIQPKPAYEFIPFSSDLSFKGNFHPVI